jgi:hypothetical protein
VQEQPGFFQESTNGGTDNTQKSKGMWVPIYIYMIKKNSIIMTLNQSAAIST